MQMTSSGIHLHSHQEASRSGYWRENRAFARTTEMSNMDHKAVGQVADMTIDLTISAVRCHATVSVAFS